MESSDVPVRGGENCENEENKSEPESSRLWRKLHCHVVPETDNTSISLNAAKKVHQGSVLLGPTLPKSPTKSQYLTKPTSSGFICSKCGKSFLTDSDLLCHICTSALFDFQSQNSSHVKEFQCTECRKSFTRKAGLVEHVRLHTGEKPFACKECGKLFARKILLLNHQKQHTGEKPFSCTECGKSFFQKSGLHIHQKIHSGAKPFSCTDCGKSFSKKYNLLRHEKMHMVDITCTECGKCFHQKLTLEVETGQKSFTCTECEKKMHVRVQPFKCSQCGDTFFRRTHLNSHQKVHEREKRFECTECGERFSKKKKFKKHQKTHSLTGDNVPEANASEKD
ncbi:hypothetical protein GDO86_007094 [Hymenochirus boettgeri]|uniref:C2H2-type domain-containing protein n=1 Tax=Hymenochirus boettgeri TaxID=247094 RepID=A0A8T2ISF1_9PIPI|nr:hypothetical protein GDO86_007094 [Hymenochirus boettgeri]